MQVWRKNSDRSLWLRKEHRAWSSVGLVPVPDLLLLKVLRKKMMAMSSYLKVMKRVRWCYIHATAKYIPGDK